MTIDVPDFDLVRRTLPSPNPNGSAADAASKPVAWSTEGKAQIGALTETAPATDVASSGLNGRLQRVAQRITSLISLFPAAIGPQAKAGALAVTLATDDPSVAQLGSLTETAPANDTASAGLNGRMQRVAQRLSSLIGLFPAALGPAAKAGSLSITTATDDPLVALLGLTNEAAGANDAAASGLRGALRLISSKLTTLLTAVATPGSKTILQTTLYDATGAAIDFTAASPVSINAGSNKIGSASIVAQAAGSGATVSRVTSAATTNATSLKASAGSLVNIDLFNNAAYTVFLKFYNKASAPTVGTDTPVWTIPIPAGAGYSREFLQNKPFATGIAYAITKLQADSDATAVAAGDLTGTIDTI